MDKDAVREVEKLLGKIELDIEKAILFGSRARGDYLKHSDVDLILVSEDFKGVDWTERGKRFYLQWEGEQPLEILCYTPEEFEKKKNMIGTVKTAAEEGIEI
ncbi:MAG: nucleotidyltransferase domain-containing protein [Candidatus Nanohalobium sp.]